MYRLIVFILIALSMVSCSINREHKEARSLTILNIDFEKLSDGSYKGFYEGGMYRWRECEVEVNIDSGRVSRIQLMNSKDPGGTNTDHSELFDRIIQEQTLQVDVISGATLTSKAYLKAVEKAILKSVNNTK